MSKKQQQHWWPPRPPSYLEDYVSTGKGVDLADANAPFSARSPWLWPEVEEYPEWFDALVEMDRTHDLKPLLELLRTGRPVPAPLWPHLDDFFRRHQTKLKRARGLPQLPSYADPINNPEHSKKAFLERAIARVKALKATGMPVKDAIERAAQELDMPEDTLGAIYKDKHGGFRRARKKSR